MIRILIIEDNETILANTAELLELEGYKSLTACNGKDGLEKIHHLVPDVILCDLCMPEMDGFSVLKHIGEYPALQRIPFIFFSVKSENIDILTGLESGADDYITKPFEMEELLKSIEKCLLKKKLS
ncbi:MAG: response regulator [Maribacter sp.]